MTEKRRGRRVTPFDLFKGSRHYCPSELAKNRLDICLSCDQLIQPTKQCKQCGCFMHLKVKLREAQCPLDKW